MSILKLLSLILLVSLPLSGLCKPEEKVLYLYYWANSIDDAVIAQFEEKTGIKVIRDYYDGEEVLESKLLSGTNLYDLVMPSASPYYAREVELTLYQPLDKKQLSNWHLLDQRILTSLQNVDPGNAYGVPYAWGTTGFVYNQDKVTPNFETYQDFMNPQHLKQYQSCGIVLLDHAQDMFEAISVANNLTGMSDSEKMIVFEKTMYAVRPYIKGFTSNAGKMINDILLGEACIVQMWSGEAQRAIYTGKQGRKRLSYVVPKDHVGAWCDLLAIPKNARHPQNAHKFIDFMLRTDIAAQNTKATLTASGNMHSKQLLPPELQNNKVLFPNHHILSKLKLAKALPLKFERRLIRLWSNIKSNR